MFIIILVSVIVGFLFGIIITSVIALDKCNEYKRKINKLQLETIELKKRLQPIFYNKLNYKKK